MGLPNAATAEEGRLPGNVLGSMGRGVLVLCEGLCETERLMTLKKLQKALILGYDSCIVTRNGTYATKKLNP